MSAENYLPAGIHRGKRLTVRALLMSYRTELALGTKLSATLALEDWVAYSRAILPECIAAVRQRESERVGRASL